MSTNVFASLLLIGICISSASADEASERPLYTPAGAPASPKVDVRWNRYHDYREATEILKNLASSHPNLVRVQSLGKSYGGRDMWVATIGFVDAPSGETRPAFWIDGGIHANEIQATEVVLYTAWYLAESAGTNKSIAKLLTERVFYLCPMLSPDSRDAHFYEPNTTNTPRSGKRPVDDDLDGLIDEDGYDDLDNDGHITMMRVEDPNGQLKLDEEYANRMIPASPGKKGKYRLLGMEGIDNDGDGLVNEDTDGSYDPNRNWGWNWQPENIQGGAHRYPFSILEDRMIADFIRSHPNIAGAQSYHNAGGMILRGPGAKDDRFDPADIAVYDEMGKVGELMLPKYRYMNIAEELYEVYGGEVDWLHQTQGVFTFTNELFTGWNFFRKEGDGGESEGGFFGSLSTQFEFDRRLLLDDGIVAWHEIDHPQYGKIEVGGLKKNWVRQPPSFLLEEECHRNMAFSLYHADQMPMVKVQDIKVTPRADGLAEVTAIVENTQLIPTHSAADLQRRITPPDRVLISGQDIVVHAGWKSSDPFFEQADEQKQDPSSIRIRSLNGRSVAYVRWLVSGTGGFVVKIQSTKGGTDQREGTL
jgi:Zinc carboxypeptidase